MRSLFLFCALTLGACADHRSADPAEIARATYVSEQSPYVELATMVNRRSGRGAHTALIVNASQRVIWDPAGTFDHEDLPEAGDIHYGATDRMVSYYKRYHARFSHYVHSQRVYVTPEIAEMVLRRTQARGAQPKMFCTVSTGQILQDVPGFTNVSPSFFPESLRKDFAVIPGVVDTYVQEQDLEKAVPTN